MQMTVNGTTAELPADPRVSLLDFLRGTISTCPGRKKDATRARAERVRCLSMASGFCPCLALAVQYAGRSITTIEGLTTGDELHPLQQAFIEHDGFQCGYCTPGQICSAIGMVDELRRGVPSHVTADLSAGQIQLTHDELRERMSGNLCRCGAYNGIVAAITENFSEVTR